MSWIRFLKKWFFDIDKFTLFFALSLMFLGILMSLTVSPAMAKRIHISDYYFTTHHIIFCIIGICIMLLCSMLSKISILNFSYIGYIFCLCLLIFVLLTGHSIKGSRRWINFGFFSLQPAELMKPFFIVMSAHFLSIAKTDRFVPVISVVNFGFLLLLFILQPDFGTSVIYSIVWLSQIFLGNSQLTILVCLLIPVSIIMCAVGFFFFPHFHYRIMNFLFLEKGREQYQTRKSIESIHNGGLLGTSLGEGEVKYQLPDAHTDYIFAVICEEFGVIFACILIICICIFAYRHFASNFMNQKYEIRVIYGLILMFTIQACVHIGVNINILPSKGMTLPFISYGGSSMLSSSIIFGFLLAFTRKSYNYNSPFRIFESVSFKKLK